MRKIAVILLGLTIGWMCGADAPAFVVGIVPYHGAQTSIDSPTPDELRCEREYNSDLGLPQSVSVESVRTLSVRTMPCPERLGVKCGVSCGRCGERVDCLPEFTMNLLIAGADAVDYYIYRLRRLII